LTWNFWLFDSPKRACSKFSGEAYESKDGCKNGIASIRENAPKAEIVDMTQ
jgi:hypothetical protein